MEVGAHPGVSPGRCQGFREEGARVSEREVSRVSLQGCIKKV